LEAQASNLLQNSQPLF